VRRPGQPRERQRQLVSESGCVTGMKFPVFKSLYTFRRAYLLIPSVLRRSFVEFSLLSLVGTFLDTASVALLIPALEIGTNQAESHVIDLIAVYLPSIRGVEPASLTLAVLIVIPVAFTARAAYSLWLTRLLSGFTYKLRAEMSGVVFRNFLESRSTSIQAKHSAVLITTATTEVGQFAVSLVNPLLMLVSDLSVVAALTALLIWSDWIMAAAVVCVLLTPTFLWMAATHNRLRSLGRRRQVGEANRLKHLTQSLSTIKEIQVRGRADDVCRAQECLQATMTDVWTSQSVLAATPRIGIEWLIAMGALAAVGSAVLTGADTTTAATSLTLFTAAALRITPALTRTITSFQSIRFATPTLDVLEAAMKSDASQEPNKTPTRELPRRGSGIEFREVTFTYPGARTPALEAASLTIPLGSIIAIVGPSGSGKSTLIDLLMGLADPQSGCIRVNDVDLRSCRRAWQNRIGFVPQRVFIAEDTIRGNIAWLHDEEPSTTNRVMEAIRISALEPLIARLPDGALHVLRENGTDISGGERQRIGIARALFGGTDILVLDEPTSALDAKTELEVFQALLQLRGRATVILATHRMELASQCDLVISVRAGRTVVQDASQPRSMAAE